MLLPGGVAWSGDLEPGMISIPAGPFVRGSDRAEREAAYRLDEAAYGHSVTRESRWYESEAVRGTVDTGAYEISVTQITNANTRISSTIPAVRPRASLRKPGAIMG